MIMTQAAPMYAYVEAVTLFINLYLNGKPELLQLLFFVVIDVEV